VSPAGLILVFALAPQGQLEALPGDPLHRVTELEVGGPDAAIADYVADFEGTLSVWASSETFDPRLWVQAEGRPSLEDEDSGGGTTAWLELEVRPGATLSIEVVADEGASGWAELHLVGAPETAATRAAADEAMAELKAIEALRRTGDIEEARARAGSLVEGLLGVEGASASALLGDGLWQAGYATNGLALLEATHAAWTGTLAVRERYLPPDHSELLGAMGNLAAMRKALGDLDGALALVEHVHAARQRVLPPEHPELLRAEQNLAITREARGDLEGALPLLEHVHAVREQRLPPDHPDVLAAKQNLAVARKALGDPEGALALEEYVHAACERQLPPDHPDVLLAKENLGMTRKDLGDVEGALALLEHVHLAYQRLLPAEHPDLLRAELNLGATRWLVEPEDARSLFEHVHAAWERQLPPDHPYLLTAKLSLAVTRAELGDRESALQLLEHVHATWERSLPRDHPNLLEAKVSLAQMRRLLGDVDGALALSRDIVQALAVGLEGAFGAAPREAQAAARSAVQQLAGARSLCDLGQTDVERESFEVLETARYVARGPLLARIAGLVAVQAAPIRTRLARAETELDGLVSRGPDLPDAGQDTSWPDAGRLAEQREEARRAWRAAIQAAALRRDRAQKELLALVGGDPITRIAADAVAQALEPGHLAIGITKLPRWRWDELAGAAVGDGALYLAQVLEPGGAPLAVDLGPAAELERAIDDWRAAIGAPIEQEHLATVAAPDRTAAEHEPLRGIGAVAREASSELAAGRALRRALIDPLLAAAGPPGAGTTIHLCLDDALFTVPVDALPLEEGTAGVEPVEQDIPRLGDLYRIRYELSMARLIQPDANPRSAASVLAVGEIDFDADLEQGLSVGEPPPRDFARGQWMSLPGTATEVAGVAALAKRYLGIEPTVLRDDDVTREALAQAAVGQRYVHLATHGWFLPRSERKSIFDDEPGRGTHALLGGRETVTGFAPLTLCGLVLSGANAGATDAERSARLLTAQELASFDLTACDLAVLSACETNVGIARAGQGIQSLQSALHMAGARTSITSLWAVRDRATQSLMERFYDNLWGQGLGKAEALWAAKRALRREGQPPFAWAGWVLAGDPD
jgi:CHAT domain-containing protein